MSNPGTFEGKIKLALHVSEPDESFIENLNYELQVTYREKQVSQEVLRNKFRFSLALILIGISLILFSMLIISPQKVMAAFTEIVGYISGIGFVEDVESVRMLEAPIHFENDKILISVEEIVAEADQTRVYYQINHIPVERNHNVEMIEEITLESTHILLSDGNVLYPIGGSEGLIDKLDPHLYQANLVFPPIPEDVKDIVLIIPRLPNMLPGAAPEDWRISIHLVSGSQGLRFLPVFNFIIDK